MEFAHILRRAGIPVVEVGDWRSRVRPGTFRPEGVLIHHTASTGFDSTLRVVRDGRPDLNGPLCNIYVARGTCYVISAGRANHGRVLYAIAMFSCWWSEQRHLRARADAPFQASVAL